VRELCRKWWVDPINRGQISPSSPSEQFLAQREGLDSRPNLLAGARILRTWCSPNEAFLAQRAPLFQVS
ncbi:hypothetical protein A2U01_0069718, partial [Trifolium medium]|nr:hypothetical protein [Trifolium medium]